MATCVSPTRVLPRFGPVVAFFLLDLFFEADVVFFDLAGAMPRTRALDDPVVKFSYSYSTRT
jgi:hypothetical protein